MRLPADGRDIVARLHSLTKRVRGDSPRRPVVDGNDRLIYGGSWVALSPIEARIAAALADQFEGVVSEAEVGRRGWQNERWRSGALRVHVTRLRRRLAPLGLEIRSVRSRGLVLQPAVLTPADAGPPSGTG